MTTMNPKRNPVKKMMDKFHRPKTHLSRKLALKRGAVKHKAVVTTGITIERSDDE